MNVERLPVHEFRLLRRTRVWMCEKGRVFRHDTPSRNFRPYAVRQIEP
jgi:hypothetical protein